MEIAASLSQLKLVQKQIVHMISIATSYQCCCNFKQNLSMTWKLMYLVSLFSTSLLIAAYECKQTDGEQRRDYFERTSASSFRVFSKKVSFIYIYIYKEKNCGPSYIQTAQRQNMQFVSFKVPGLQLRGNITTCLEKSVMREMLDLCCFPLHLPYCSATWGKSNILLLENSVQK